MALTGSSLMKEKEVEQARQCLPSPLPKPLGCQPCHGVCIWVVSPETKVLSTSTQALHHRCLHPKASTLTLHQPHTCKQLHREEGVLWVVGVAAGEGALAGEGEQEGLCCWGGK